MNAVNVIKDTLCGCASGVAQVVAMMPLENIITKMITKPQEYPSFIRATMKTIKEQGIFSFYKGMLAPLLGVGFQVSLQFAVVETLKKVMRQKYGDQHGNLAPKYIILSGILAGIPSAICVTPLDHARFRVLMNKQNTGPGSVRTAVNIFSNYGFRKLFLGFNSTLLRQAVGLGIYFASYDFFFPNIIDSSFAAGGVAGLLTWIMIYPIHVVKVRIQTDCLDNPKYKSAFQCGADIIKNQEIGKMYKGVGWMLLRAFLVNGAGFVAFQNAKKILYKSEKF